ncbi:MAG: hypothetical protein JXA46_04650 [Dehalococcoidales bacterium]|nr:hypothetical protein [Dehalococcoidales bacterium]
MNLSEMLALVRRDLKDENETAYRWTDEELERCIDRVVMEFSRAIPREVRTAVDTVSASREIDIGALTGCVMVEAVEYPSGLFPPAYRRFSIWGDVITLLEGEMPDGSACYIYYGKLHELDESGSTIPDVYEDLVVCGACGYAACAAAGYAINRVNTGGQDTPEDWEKWGKARLSWFREQLKKLGRKSRVRVSQLYIPYRPAVAISTDRGPG